MHRYATQVSQDNKHSAKEKKQHDETVVLAIYRFSQG